MARAMDVVTRGPFVVSLWSVVDRLNGKDCRSFRHRQPLDFDLYFNCNEVGITHTPNLVKIFSIIFRR